ncbi:MAG TPA: carboxypeptidase-like regulatory domain-containing protein [Chthoniobacterales bacterium]|nr:carboxypeptidase-like regulatory domain-containing protein [Chthoniobacterales bacterium]
MTPQKRASRQAHSPQAQPGSITARWDAAIILYALIALVSFACGVALLGLMVWKADRLVSLGLTGNLYYIVLLPLGLSAAAFLFGVLKSYARFRGRYFNGVLELGGPVVGFALVVIGGFVLVKSPDTFPLTVFVHGDAGRQDVALRNSGHVVLDLGPDRRREPIGENGQAYFPAVPAAFRGQPVLASVESDSYEPVKPGEMQRLDSSRIYLPVRKKSAVISGRVQDRDGNPIPGASLSIAGISATSDAAGRFEFALPGPRVKPELELYTTASGYKPTSHIVTAGKNEITVVLTAAP